MPLILRSLIPPLTARTADGSVVRAWDYKQRTHLAIAFLQAADECVAYATAWAAAAAEFYAHNSVALVIFSPALPTALPAVAASPPEPLPRRRVVLAYDMGGQSQQAFLGEGAFHATGQAQLGVFVADRFGELAAQWQARHVAELPPLREVLGELSRLELACEECHPPEWPAG